MAKLVKVGVQVPDSYPENSPVEVVYPSAYYAAARAAGGMVEGKLGPASGGFRPIVSKTGTDLLVYGGEVGDPLPPLVQIRVKPRATGVKGLDWHIEGHPRDTGSAAWDGSAIGQGASGQTIVTETQASSLTDLIASGQQQQAQVVQLQASLIQTKNDVSAAIQAEIGASLIARGIDPQYIAWQPGTLPPAASEGTWGAWPGQFGLVTGQYQGGQWVAKSDTLLTEAGMASRPQIAYVSAEGSDVRGYVGRDYRPFRTLAAAMAALTAGGGHGRIRVAGGIYDAPDPALWADGLHIKGEGIAAWGAENRTINAQYGGTVLRGNVAAYSRSWVGLHDLSVDAGAEWAAAHGVDGRDPICISSYTPGNSAAGALPMYPQIRNVQTLGAAPDAQYHACLIEGAIGIDVDGLMTDNCHHGLTLKTLGGNVRGLRAGRHYGEAFIFRASPVVGLPKFGYLNVSDVSIDPNVSHQTGGIRLTANEAGSVIEKINVNNVVMRSPVFGLHYELGNGAVIANCTMSNWQIDNPVLDGVWVDGQGSVQGGRHLNLNVTAGQKRGFWYSSDGQRQIDQIDCNAIACAWDGARLEGWQTRIIGGRYQASGGFGVYNTSDNGVGAFDGGGNTAGDIGGSHRIQAVYEMAWSDAPLASGHTAVNSATPQYRRTQSGKTELRGLVAGAVGALCTVPAIFAPIQPVRVGTTYRGGGAWQPGNLVINPDGNINLDGGPDADFVSLDGIQF